MKKLILSVLALAFASIAIAGCHARADVDDNKHMETSVGVAR
jgi:hypothetical protein